MASKEFDVVLVVIDDRGYRLARDLALAGLTVGWVDLTDNSRGGSRDWSGPFCIQIPKEATELERREFLQDKSFEEIPEGFCLWHGGGVFEGRGALRDFQLSQMEQPEVTDFFYDSFRAGFYQENLVPRQVPFGKRWLLELMTSFDSARDPYFQDENPSGKIRNVLSTFHLASHHFSLRKRRLDELSVFGVESFKASNLQVRRTESGFELVSERTGTIACRHLCNFLSVQQCRQMDATFTNQVFKDLGVKSQWHWQRCDVHFEEPLRAGFPQWILLLPFWDLPWCEENFVILKREPEGGPWSLWFKMESKLSGETQFRAKILRQLEGVLRDQFRVGSFVVSWPRDGLRGKMGLNIEPFPLFSRSMKPKSILSPNFHHCGPDGVMSFDLFALYRRQKEILQSILTNGDCR